MESCKNKDLLSLTHAGEENEKYLNAVVPPVFLTSLHVFKTFEEYSSINIFEEDNYIYGRDSNPTVHIVERKIAELEHGSRAVVFSSGMAAATSAIMATCKAGSHIICLRDVYQPVKRFLNNVCIPNLNMSVTYLTGLDLEELESNVQENTSLIILESPATFVFTATNLRFIDVSPSPKRQEYFTKTFAKFKESNSIEVAYESVPWDEAANKLTVMGASKQLPDVMTTWAGWLGQYTAAKWVLPIDKYIEGTENQYTNVVTDIVWKSERQLYGATYTVPDGMMVKGVFVRKDWAEEAGITLDPDKGWTYDEYFEVVKKLTDVSKKRYGTSYRGARGAFDPLLVYLESLNGGSLYAQDGSILIKSEESLEGFKKWANLYLGGYAPKDAINWGFTEMVDNFAGGLTGTLINDSEVAATLQTNMKPEQWMVMPMPKSTKDGKIYNTVNSPYAYTISGDAKDPDSAWKLIEFLTRPDNNIEYSKIGGLIPIKKDVANDPTYGTNGPYSAFVKQLNNPDLVVPVSYGPFDYTDMHQGMLHEEVQKYLLDKQDAKTSLYKIANELESRMKKYLADNPGSTVELPKSISESK